MEHRIKFDNGMITSTTDSNSIEAMVSLADFFVNEALERIQKLMGTLDVRHDDALAFLEEALEELSMDLSTFNSRVDEMDGECDFYYQKDEAAKCYGHSFKHRFTKKK